MTTPEIPDSISKDVTISGPGCMNLIFRNPYSNGRDAHQVELAVTHHGEVTRTYTFRASREAPSFNEKIDSFLRFKVAVLAADVRNHAIGIGHLSYRDWRAVETFGDEEDRRFLAREYLLSCGPCDEQTDKRGSDERGIANG